MAKIKWSTCFFKLKTNMFQNANKKLKKPKVKKNTIQLKHKQNC
jgi:hypothetical protein